MPKYFMDLKKNVGGGGVYAKIFYGLEKMLGGGGVMPKYFMDLKKCLGVCQQILCMDFKKKLGGGWLCPNILLT